MWIAIMLNMFLLLWYAWPRLDGGGVPYSLISASMAGPGGIDLTWYVLAALILPWAIWGAIVNA